MGKWTAHLPVVCCPLFYVCVLGETPAGRSSSLNHTSISAYVPDQTSSAPRRRLTTRVVKLASDLSRNPASPRPSRQRAVLLRARDAAAGLAYLHSRGVVHADVKAGGGVPELPIQLDSVRRLPACAGRVRQCRALTCKPLLHARNWWDSPQGNQAPARLQQRQAENVLLATDPSDEFMLRAKLAGEQGCLLHLRWHDQMPCQTPISRLAFASAPSVEI
jgi:serine/threonine protein kinase